MSSSGTNPQEVTMMIINIVLILLLLHMLHLQEVTQVVMATVTGLNILLLLLLEEVGLLDNSEAITRIGVVRIIITTPLHFPRVPIIITIVSGTLALRSQGDIIIAPPDLMSPLLPVTEITATTATLGLDTSTKIPDPLLGVNMAEVARPLLLLTTGRTTEETTTIPTLHHQIMVLFLLIDPLRLLSLPEEVPSVRISEEGRVILPADAPPLPPGGRHVASRHPTRGTIFLHHP